MSAPAASSALAVQASGSVLGAMLRNPEAARLAAEQLSPTDFPTDDLRTCFLAMRNVQQRGEHVDCLTVYQELARLGHKDTRWSLMLDDLFNAVPSAAGVVSHIRILKEASRDCEALRVLRLAALRAEEGNAVAVLAEVLARPAPQTESSGECEVPEWPTLHPAALHGLAGDIVREVEPFSEAAPVAILVNLLVAFGNMVGRGPGFTVESTRHHLNLFAVLVGATAGGRKGQSWGTPRRLAEMVDREWAKFRVKEGLSSGEGLVFNVRDAITKTETDKAGVTRDMLVDAGVDDKRLLVMEGEFAQVLKVMQREGNTLSPTLRRAWDGGDVLSPMTKSNAIQATGAHISILGHITQGELLMLLGQTECSNGLANRFLWLCVRQSKFLPDGEPIPKEILVQLACRLGEAVAFAASAIDITRDLEAISLWRGIYRTLGTPRPGLVGSLTARTEAQVMRLACIYSLLDKSTLVRPEHLRAALALQDYVAESVSYVFGRRMGDPVADKCLEAIQAAGESGLNLRKLHLVLGNNVSAARLTAALQALAGLGLVETRPEKTGGRPATMWFAVA